MRTLKVSVVLCTGDPSSVKQACMRLPLLLEPRLRALATVSGRKRKNATARAEQERPRQPHLHLLAAAHVAAACRLPLAACSDSCCTVITITIARLRCV